VISVSTLFAAERLERLEKNLDNQDTMQVGADQKKKLLRPR
jgi:hypothetical protein